MIRETDISSFIRLNDGISAIAQIATLSWAQRLPSTVPRNTRCDGNGMAWLRRKVRHDCPGRLLRAG